MVKQPNLDMLARASHAVINRLNFPKREAKAMTRKSALAARLRPLLSYHDCEDVKQTCALVLTASGALYREKLTLADWIGMFRACRATLRIDRQFHEHATDLATLDTIPVSVSEPERFTARRSAIARKIRYHRACIAEAFRLDKSRQRGHNRRKALQMLRFVASQARGAGLGQATITSAHDLAGLRMAKMSFQRYIDAGETELERQGRLDVAMRNRSIKPEQIKSFDQLQAKRGRKVAIAA